MPRMRVTSWFWNTSPRPGSATNTPIGSWSRVAASSCREWRSDWVSRARSSADEVASASARTYASCASSNGCGEAKPSVRQPIARPSRTMGMLADARWPSAMNAGAKSGQRCAAAARSRTSTSRPSRIDSTDGIAASSGRTAAAGVDAAVALAGEERRRSPRPRRARARRPTARRRRASRPAAACARSTPAHARPRSRRASWPRSRPGGARASRSARDPGPGRRAGCRPRGTPGPPRRSPAPAATRG